jgi:ribosomal protein S18 acetylase RimI-like enzyme
MMAGEIAEMDVDTPAPAGLIVQLVEDEGRHAEWMSVMTGGFDLEDPVTFTIDQTAKAVGFDPDGRWLRFVGTVDGRAVSTSGLMLFGGLAGIYNVATLREDRRRGYGTALTRAAVAHARDLGYRVAVLGASDLGRGVYERMGFRDVCVVRQYVHDG